MTLDDHDKMDRMDQLDGASALFRVLTHAFFYFTNLIPYV